MKLPFLDMFGTFGPCLACPGVWFRTTPNCKSLAKNGYALRFGLPQYQVSDESAECMSDSEMVEIQSHSLVGLKLRASSIIINLGLTCPSAPVLSEGVTGEVVDCFVDCESDFGDWDRTLGCITLTIFIAAIRVQLGNGSCMFL